jgi:hypothetical protein
MHDLIPAADDPEALVDPLDRHLGTARTALREAAHLGRQLEQMAKGKGLSQISGVNGSVGVAADLSLRSGAHCLLIGERVLHRRGRAEATPRYNRTRLQCLAPLRAGAVAWFQSGGPPCQSAPPASIAA